MVDLTFQKWIKKNPEEILNIWFEEVILNTTSEYEDNFTQEEWVKWRLEDEDPISFEYQMMKALAVCKKLNHPRIREKEIMNCHWIATKRSINSYLKYLGPDNRILAMTDPLSKVRLIASELS